MSILTSINYLFLTSLALTSWIILCYFHKIEARKLKRFHVNFNMDRSYMNEAIVQSPETKCQSNYDIYLNIICMLACIYSLAKIANCAENYIVRRFHSKFAYGFNTNNESSDSVNDYKMKFQKLMAQVVHLENQNMLLENRLQEFQEMSLQMHMSGEDDETTTKDAQPSDTRTQNIFISNKYFHMNRQFFTNEGNMKRMHRSKDDFPHIWEKYIKLQQLSITDETPKTDSLDPENLSHSPYVPAIISLEELRNNEDLYKCL